MTVVFDPPLSEHDAAALDTYRVEIERLLAAPSASVVDALTSFLVSTVRINVEAAHERAWTAGRAASDEALAAARGHREILFDDFVALLAKLARDAGSVEEAREKLAPSCADLVMAQRQIQRDTDRGILVAEANRRLSVAANFPDLAGPAEASSKLLRFAADLIDAGVVPEDVALMVASLQAARRAEQEGSAKGKHEPTEAEVAAGKQHALAFLKQVAEREGGEKVLKLAASTVGVKKSTGEVVHDAGGVQATHAPDYAVALGLALLTASYAVQAGTVKKPGKGSP
jgi:hypothetical protein